MGKIISFQPRKYCPRCKTELNASNTSKEHIIPNCLGGREKPKFLICQTCNQDFDKIDAGLCDAFDFFDSYLLVKKDRNTGYRTILGKTDAGEVYLIDGRPEFIKQVVDNPNGSKTIRTVDHDRAQTILNGLRSKHGDAIQIGDVQKEEGGRIQIPLKIVSPEAWRGIAKILFDAIYYFNSDYQPCENLIEKILEKPWEEVSKKCPIAFAPEGVTVDLPPEFNREAWMFSHCVIIEYRPQEKCIIGYVQIYNIPYVALVEDEYSGEAGCIGYFINPLTSEHKILELSEEIPISKADLEHAIREWLTADTLSLLSKRLSQATTSAIHHNEFERAFLEAAEETNIAEGELITEEFGNKLADRLTNSSMVMDVVDAITFPNRVLEVLYSHLSQWLTLNQIQSALLQENIKTSLQQIESAIKVLEADPARISEPLRLEQRDSNGILEVRVIYPTSET